MAIQSLKGFNPNASTEDIIQSSSSFKNLDTSASGIGQSIAPYNWKTSLNPFGNVIPKTSNEVLTGEGSTSTSSGESAVTQKYVKPTKKVDYRDIVSSVSSKRSELGLEEVDKKDLPIVQPGSTVDKLNNAIKRGDYNSAFALSVSNALSPETEYIKSTLSDAKDGIKPLLYGLGVVFGIGGKSILQSVGSTSVAGAGTYMISKNNINKFIDDSEDAPYKILDNLKKQSIGEVIGSSGKSLLKGTYSSSYSVGSALQEEGFDNMKKAQDYLFGFTTGTSHIEGLYKTKAEAREDMKKEEALDPSSKARFDEINKYTTIIDITADVIGSFGMSSVANIASRIASISREGAMIGPMIAPLASSLQALINPSMGALAKIGGAVAIGDVTSYAITGKRLSQGDKVAEEGLNTIEGMGVIGGVVKGAQAGAPVVKKLFTDSFSTFDSMVKSEEVKVLLNASDSARKEFLKGYQSIQTTIQKGLQSTGDFIEANSSIAKNKSGFVGKGSINISEKIPSSVVEEGKSLFHGTGEKDVTVLKSMRQLRFEGSDVESSNIGSISPFVHLTEDKSLAQGYANARMVNVRGKPKVGEYNVGGNVLDLTKQGDIEASKFYGIIGKRLTELSGNSGADSFLGSSLLTSDVTKLGFSPQINFRDIESSEYLPQVLDEYGFSGVKFFDKGFIGEPIPTYAIIPERIKYPEGVNAEFKFPTKISGASAIKKEATGDILEAKIKEIDEITELNHKISREKTAKEYKKVSFSDKLVRDGLLSEEDATSTRKVIIAGAKRLMSSRLVNFYDRYFISKDMAKRAGKELETLPDIYMESIASNIHIMKTSMDDIEKSLFVNAGSREESEALSKENLINFQQFLTDKRQYDLTKARELQREEIESTIKSLTGVKGKEDELEKAKELLDTTPSRLQSYKNKDETRALTAKEYMEWYEIGHKYKEDVYEPQIKKFNEVNYSILDGMRMNGRISEESYESLRNQPTYVKTQFIFDNNEENIGEAMYKSTKDLQGLKSGTDEGVANIAVFDNMIRQHSLSIALNMRNKTALVVADIAKNVNGMKIVDEAPSVENVPYLEDGVKKYIIGPKREIEYIRTLMGLDLDLLSKIRGDSVWGPIHRVASAPTRFIKKVITGPFTLFQQEMIPVEKFGAILNSAIENKGKFDTGYDAKFFGKAIGKEDKEGDVMRFLAKATGLSVNDTFVGAMGREIEVPGIISILEKAQKDSGVAPVSVKELMESIYGKTNKNILGKAISGVEHFGSAGELHTSRMGTFVGNIKSQMDTVYEGRIQSALKEMFPEAKSIKDLSIKDLDSIYNKVGNKLTLGEVAKAYDEFGKNPSKLIKWLSDRGVDPYIASSLARDQFSYNRAIDEIRLLNEYVAYTQAAIENTRKTTGQEIKMGKGLYAEASELAKGKIDGQFHYMKTAGTILGMTTVPVYYAVEFNNTPERREMAKFDPSPENFGLYLRWNKDSNGNELRDREAVKLDISRILPGMARDVMLAEYSAMMKFKQLDIPNGDKILKKWIANKVFTAKYSDYSGFSFGGNATAFTIVSDFTSPPTNMTKKTYAAGIVLAHISGIGTGPQITKMINDIFGKRSADFQNLMVATMEAAGVDVDGILNGGVDKYSESVIRNWLDPKKSTAERIGKILFDMSGLQEKKISTMSSDESNIIKETTSIQGKEYQKNQLLDQSIDNQLSKIIGDSEIDSEDVEKVYSVISELDPPKGVDVEEYIGRAEDRIKSYGKSTKSERIGNLSVDNYYEVILSKIEAPEDKYQKAKESFDNGELSQGKFEDIVLRIGKEAGIK